MPFVNAVVYELDCRVNRFEKFPESMVEWRFCMSNCRKRTSCSTVALANLEPRIGWTLIVNGSPLWP